MLWIFPSWNLRTLNLKNMQDRSLSGAILHGALKFASRSIVRMEQMMRFFTQGLAQEFLVNLLDRGVLMGFSQF